MTSLADNSQGLGTIVPLPVSSAAAMSSQSVEQGGTMTEDMAPDGSNKKQSRKQTGKRGRRPSKTEEGSGAAADGDASTTTTASGEKPVRKRRRTTKASGSSGTGASSGASTSIDWNLLQLNIQSVFEVVFFAEDDYDRPVRAAFMSLPSREDLPEYYTVVQQPVSLNELESSTFPLAVSVVEI